MANNIYIGMRYVPLFDGTYNSEKVYEPLTVVEYNNSSYTSKRQVPAGILPTNTEYWARSGDFNAQYNELDGRITTAQNTANSANTAAANAASAASAAQSAASAAQTTANGAVTAAGNAQSAAEDAQDDADRALAMIMPQNLRNQDVILIGDSYAYGTGASPVKGWAGYFVDMTECNLVGYAYQNGGGFAAPGNENATYPNYTYDQCLGSIASNMTADARANVKLIIAQSGWNDASSTRNPGGTSAVGTGIASFLTTCKNSFPNARVVVIPTWNETAIDTPQKWNTLVDYIGIAFWWGKCAATSESINWFYGTGVGAGDSIHLNATGYERLAKFIFAFVSGWDGKIKGSSHENHPAGWF